MLGHFNKPFIEQNSVYTTESAFLDVVTSANTNEAAIWETRTQDRVLALSIKACCHNGFSNKGNDMMLHYKYSGEYFCHSWQCARLLKTHSKQKQDSCQI